MIITAIQNFALSTPNKIALKGAYSALNYADLNREITRMMVQLKTADPTVLGIAMDNSPAWAIVDLAAMALGIPTVPLPLFFSSAQMAHAIQEAGIDVLLSDKPIQIRQLLAHQSIQYCAETHYLVGDKMLTEFSAPMLMTTLVAMHSAQTLPSATAKITYSSGSTGNAKGVCISKTTMQTVAQSLRMATDANAHDQHLCLLPLCTLLENIAGLYTPLLAGATVVILPLQDVGMTGSNGLNAQKMLQAMHDQAATSLILTPELLLALVCAIEAGYPAPPQLRFIAVGGASVSPRLLQRADALNLAVFEGYGLPECASVVAPNLETSQDE